MKPYFIGNAFDGCYYVRCLLPQNQNGWAGEKEHLSAPRKSLEVVAKEILDYDTIIFQRPDEMVRVDVAKKLKALGKKIVFDNDDTFKNIDVKNIKLIERLDTKVKATDEFLKIADLVTTTTEFLANEYRELSDNVIILPNCIEPYDWGEVKKNKTDKVTIGIVGSTTSTRDFLQIENLLHNLNNMPDVQIVMFGLPVRTKQTERVAKMYTKEYDWWNQFDIEWQPFVNIHEYADILNGLMLDIMLIPREDNYFNHCKSNVKFLEASMCEIPVIAQGFEDGLSPYQGVEDSKYLEIAHNNKEWLVKTLSLINDKALRDKMGKEAHEYVLTNYNIHDKGKLWREEYQKLWNIKQ